MYTKDMFYYNSINELIGGETFPELGFSGRYSSHLNKSIVIYPFQMREGDRKLIDLLNKDDRIIGISFKFKPLHQDKIDLAFLENHPQIEYLSFEDVRIESASAIYDLPNLKEIFIHNKSMSFDLKKIQRVQVIGGHVASFMHINEATSLKHIVGTWTSKHNVSSEYVQYLSGGIKEAKDVQYLSAFSSLQKIKLHGQRMTALDGMSGLSKLKELEITYCKNLSDIDDLEDSSVEYLSFQNIPNMLNHEILTKCAFLKTLKLINCGTIENIRSFSTSNSLERFIFMGTDVKGGDLSSLLTKNWEYLMFDNKRHFSHKHEDFGF